jgi:hypothetical protein
MSDRLRRVFFTAGLFACVLALTGCAGAPALGGLVGLALLAAGALGGTSGCRHVPDAPDDDNYEYCDNPDGCCKDGYVDADGSCIVKNPPIEDLDGDGYDVVEDCNDDDANIHPNALETCNGVDDDCDGAVDGDDACGVENPWPDDDGDGWTLPEDCNDADADVNPGAGEDCANGRDDDCNGLADAHDPECTPS